MPAYQRFKVELFLVLQTANRQANRQTAHMTAARICDANSTAPTLQSAAQLAHSAAQLEHSAEHSLQTAVHSARCSPPAQHECPRARCLDQAAHAYITRATHKPHNRHTAVSVHSQPSQRASCGDPDSTASAGRSSQHPLPAPRKCGQHHARTVAVSCQTPACFSAARRHGGRSFSRGAVAPLQHTPQRVGTACLEMFWGQTGAACTQRSPASTRAQTRPDRCNPQPQ